MSISRSDQPRLGASCGVLGTVLEARGETAWDVMSGWEFGPRKAPQTGERGGGGGEAGQEDRKDEAIQRARAARHFREHRADLTALDELVQRILRRIDVACPPNPEEVKNRSGDLDPVTPADVAIAGYCSSCWRNDQQMVLIEVNKHSLRYYRDYCRWCGSLKATYGIEPPLEMLKLHHAGRRISEKDMEAAVKAAVDAQPKSKKSKRQAKRKGKQAA